MKSIKRSVSPVLLYTICLLNLLFMHIYIVSTCDTEFGLNWISWIDNLSGIMFDFTFILLISNILFYKNSRLAIISTFIITTGWAFSNVIYSRFFHSYITLSSIGQVTSLLDPVVLSSTFQGFYWQDFYFIVIIILFILLFIRLQENIIKRKTIIPIICLTIALFGASMTAHAIDCIVNPGYRYLTYYGNRLFIRHIDKHHAICAPIITTFHRGSLRMLCIELSDQIKGVEGTH